MPPSDRFAAVTQPSRGRETGKSCTYDAIVGSQALHFTAPFLDRSGLQLGHCAPLSCRRAVALGTARSISRSAEAPSLGTSSAPQMIAGTCRGRGNESLSSLRERLPDCDLVRKCLWCSRHRSPWLWSRLGGDSYHCRRLCAAFLRSAQRPMLYQTMGMHLS
jgi:hypothetical protein